MWWWSLRQNGASFEQDLPPCDYEMKLDVFSDLGQRVEYKKCSSVETSMKNSSWTFRSLEYVTAVVFPKRRAPIAQCHGVVSIRATVILTGLFIYFLLRVRLSSVTPSRATEFGSTSFPQFSSSSHTAAKHLHLMQCLSAEHATAAERTKELRHINYLFEWFATSTSPPRYLPSG
jgi:hypothetical protein